MSFVTWIAESIPIAGFLVLLLAAGGLGGGPPVPPITPIAA